MKRKLFLILILVVLTVFLLACNESPDIIDNTTDISETDIGDVYEGTNPPEDVCQHSYSIVEALPATCKENGYTQHRVCNACGDKEGYSVILARHSLTECPNGEDDPMFYRCICGFSMVTELKTRPLIDQLTDAQFIQFEKLYNMFKNRESFCELDISMQEYLLFYDLIQGQCPEIFLLEYENAAPIMYLKGSVGRVEWNPYCMSDEEYTKTAKTIANIFLDWESECRGLSDTEKVRYIVEWLVENTEFETIGTNVRSLYGGIIERKIACVGYAQILSLAMNAFDIPCMAVSGTVGDEGHMWNLVKLDGEWYQVDAGWNYVNINGTNYSHNGYVNVTDDELNIGSKRTYNDFYKNHGINIPVCTATSQNIARLSGNYLNSSSDVESVFNNALIDAAKSGESLFTLICKDKNTQQKIFSYSKGDSVKSKLDELGVGAIWLSDGHDDRTDIYYVSCLIANDNRRDISLSSQTLKAGAAYKLAIRQEQNGHIVFFSGKATENRLSTVDDPMRATDVFYKEVDGGFRLWFFDGYMKKYIDVITAESGTVQAAISLDPTSVFRFDDATGAIVAAVNGEDYWLGAYNESSALSSSKLQYISGENSEKIGKTQFLAELVTVGGIEPTQMVEPAIPEGKGTSYKLVMEQNKLGKTLYFQGWRTRNFPASTTDKEKSPNVYLEKVDGGYQLYYLWGENKMYINVQGFRDKGVSVQLRPTPGVPFTYNESLGLYTVEMYGVEYYLGSYNTYDNFSLSDIKYITGENASKIGISQFPAYLVEVDE